MRCSDNIAELCKGSTTVSESVCRGSNPCSAAKKGRLFFEKRDGPFLLCKKARF